MQATKQIRAVPSRPPEDIAEPSQETLHPWYYPLLPHGRPKVMAEDTARAQGIFIPNWWLAMLLIPMAGGVLWIVITLTSIQANQAALRDTLEFRLKQVEVQSKMNDEHMRQMENRLSRVEGRKNVAEPPDSAQ